MIVEVPWVIGEEGEEAVLDVECVPGERAVMFDANGEGYPGSAPTAEIINARIFDHETGKYRIATDEEWAGMENAREEIEAQAFVIADEIEKPKNRRRCFFSLVEGF